MAFNTSALSTYTEKSKEIMYNGVLASGSISNYKVYRGINGSQYVNFIDVDVNEQASNCGLDSSGTTSVTQKTITVGDFTFVNDLCMRDLDGFALPTTPGVVYDDMESQVMDTILASTYQGVKKRIDLSLWQGTLADGYLIDGIVKQISGCTGRHSMTTYSATNLALTAATSSTIDNVIDEAIANMTQDFLTGAQIVKIHVPYEYYQLYTLWRANNAAANIPTLLGEGSVSPFEQWVFGREGQIKLVMEPGLVGTDYIIATNDDNIAIGTDLPQEIEAFSNARFEYDNISRKLYHFIDFRLGVIINNCDKVVANF